MAMAGGITDLKAILDRAAQTLRRRSLVFVVSDFISDEGWEAPLGRLAQRHEVFAVWLSDPREEEMPAIGPLVLQDAETGQQVYVDTSDPALSAPLSGAGRGAARRASSAPSRVSGIDAMRLTTDGNMVQEIARFAHLRREMRRRAAGRATGGVGL